jgi:uncharacterized membrane protein HdeD (DUF308 family)
MTIDLSTEVPSAEAQVREAQLDNSASWRSSGIVCLLLLILFPLAWIIPIVLIATLIGNNGRIERARRGEYLGAPADEAKARAAIAQREKAAKRWLFIGLLGVIGLLLIVGGIASDTPFTVVIGALLLIAGVLVVIYPWETTHA